jgi:hypothetical protein
LVVVVVVVVVVIVVVVVDDDDDDDDVDVVGLGKSPSRMFQKTTFTGGPPRHHLGRIKPKTLLSQTPNA